MTIEEKLKNYILAEYKSIREFCMKNNFPYSTVDSIFKRGIMGSSVSLMISICDRLNIDIDKLADGEIVQKSAASRSFSNIAQITTKYRCWVELHAVNLFMRQKSAKAMCRLVQI